MFVMLRSIIAKILTFLSTSSGELSSRRLIFVLASITFVIGSVYFTNKLINGDEFEAAVEMFSYLGIFCTVVGGFVTADVH